MSTRNAREGAFLGILTSWFNSGMQEMPEMPEMPEMMSSVCEQIFQQDILSIS